jgi:hypothetical protein
MELDHGDTSKIEVDVDVEAETEGRARVARGHRPRFPPD